MNGRVKAATWENTCGGRSARRVLAALTLTVAMLTPIVAWAQSGIAGAVSATSGAVLPGVTVEAASPALMEKVRTVVTVGLGQYKIIDLRPGLYTVSFTLPGFSTVKREGVELPAAFTATVNAELKVGTVEETVTVSGEALLVDVQRTSQRNVMSKEILDAVPIQRMVQSYTVFIPGVVTSGSGISRGLGTDSGALAIHGSSAGEAYVAIDGFNTSRGTGGQGFYYIANTATIQEVVVSTGAAGAEQPWAGLVTNSIPREGGNTFSGQVYFHYTNDHFSQSNLTDTLKAQGVSPTGAIRESWDFNPGVGGPIKTNKLWFFGSYRHWGNEVDAGIRYNLTPTAWAYRPDLSRPAATFRLSDRSYAARLTWQATQKNKFSIFYDQAPRNWYNRSVSPIVSPEASTWSPYRPNYLTSLTWKSPVSNRILLEAGGQYIHTVLWLYHNDHDPNLFNGPAGSAPDPAAIGATELTTSLQFRSAVGAAPAAPYGIFATNSTFWVRAAVSYITGSHAFKVGVDDGIRDSLQDQYVNGDYSVNLRNGAPVSLTLYGSSKNDSRTKAVLGIYAQDQWTLHRLTLNLGVRYDYLNAYIPAQDVPATRWLPARRFDPVDGVPRWHDISPRLGGSYDLFGTGKTALKATLNRYVNAANGPIANSNPVLTSVTSANRNWTDDGRNGGIAGDFLPQCDFSNPQPNGECGILSNLNFGRNNPRATRNDPAIVTGFGVRGYNWESSAAIQHELLQGLSVNVGYFRRWYGNFTVLQNQSVTPADYDPYCITFAVDARLPNGGGYRQCGYYDVSLAKVGQSTNLVTKASNFQGQRSDVFNGVDLTVSARWPNGAQLTGGTSTGREEIKTCQVVDTPQALLFCDNKPPFQTQLKFLGVYPLPWWGIQVSGAFQSVPGPEISSFSITGNNQGTSYVATNNEVKSTLGRDLSSGANGTVTVPMIQPGTMYGDRWSQLDVRFTKNLQIGRTLRLLASLDIFNILNSSATQAVNVRYGPDWLKPTQILSARLFRLSGQLNF
ncbi:MAG: hypothetical protein DMF92_11595 [Acidobacteria bacterium]|nr:MAG: hypothetical protein DMF92_11595 [Acidobacteriota bacterium]